MDLTTAFTPDPRRVFLLGLHEQHLAAFKGSSLAMAAWSSQGERKFRGEHGDTVAYDYQVLEHARFPPAFRADLSDPVRELVADWVRPLYLRNAMRLAAEGRPGRHSLLDLENRLQRSIHFYLDMLLRHHVGTVVFGAPPHLGTQVVLYAAAIALGLHTVIAEQSQFGGRFWLFDRLGNYAAVADGPETGSASIALPEKPTVPFYMSRIPSGIAASTRYAAKEWVKFAAKTASLSFLFRPDPWRRNLSRLRTAGQDARMRHDARHHHGTCDFDRPFIYLPLHLQPELTTDILGGPYWDQLLAAEELARRLPDGMSLYVKENPAQGRFMRETSFFERLSAIPNVVFLPPDVPSFALIEASRAVATVSGTAGWEALLMGRPVILFGHTWYGRLPGTFEWFDRSEAEKDALLPEALAHRSDRNELSRAFQSLTQRLHPGVVSFEYGKLIEGFDEDREAQSAVDAIAAHVAGLAPREAGLGNARTVRTRLGPRLA